MTISEPLFVGERINLGAINHEHDPLVESVWTHDADFMRMLSLDMAMPLSPSQVKKRYEDIEKSQAEDKDSTYLQVRLNADQRLIGFGEVYGIEWSNAVGFIRLGIGNQTDRRQGYGSEILKLLLKFAFHELNLFRLTALIAGYNQPAIRLFKINKIPGGSSLSPGNPPLWSPMGHVDLWASGG